MTFFFFFFFKPQTHTTFIIKTQNQKPPSSSFQLGVGGCWSEPSSAMWDPVRPPVRLWSPVSSSEWRASTSQLLLAVRGEGPGSHEADLGPFSVNGATAVPAGAQGPRTKAKGRDSLGLTTRSPRPTHLLLQSPRRGCLPSPHSHPQTQAPQGQPGSQGTRVPRLKCYNAWF